MLQVQPHSTSKCLFCSWSCDILIIFALYRVNATNSSNWNPFLTDILQIGEDANYMALLRFVLVLLKLRSNNGGKRLLETLVLECSTEDNFSDYISKAFSMTCTYWQNNKEYRVEDGVVVITNRYANVAQAVMTEIEAHLSAPANSGISTKPLELPVMMMLLGFNPYRLSAAERNITTTELRNTSVNFEGLFIGKAEGTKARIAALLKKLALIDAAVNNSPAAGKNSNSKAFSAMLASLAKCYVIEDQNSHTSFDFGAFCTNAVSFQHERGGFGLVWLFLMIGWIVHGSPQSYGRATAPIYKHPALLMKLILFNHHRNPTKVFPAVIHQYLIHKLKAFEPHGRVQLADGPTNTIDMINKNEVFDCPEILDHLMLQNGTPTLDAYEANSKTIGALCEARPTDVNLLKKFLKLLSGLAEIARSTTMDARRRTHIQNIVNNLRRAKETFASNGFADTIQATKLQMVRVVKAKKPVMQIFEGL